MTDPGTGEVTRLLVAWREGDASAADGLMPLIYDELRRIADRLMRGERSGHTWQATELVHEVYVRLAGAQVPWQDRVHFYAVAARAMRRMLVDHARGRRAEKRGAGAVRVTLGESLAGPIDSSGDLLDLDRALERLSRRSPRRARAVELHFFAGMTHQEIAALQQVSLSTVRGDLRFARAWLGRELSAGAL